MIKITTFASTLLPNTTVMKQGHSPLLGSKWKCQRNNKYTRNFLRGNGNDEKDRAYYFKICSASAFAVMFRFIFAWVIVGSGKIADRLKHYSVSRLRIFPFLFCFCCCYCFSFYQTLNTNAPKSVSFLSFIFFSFSLSCRNWRWHLTALLQEVSFYLLPEDLEFFPIC